MWPDQAEGTRPGRVGERLAVGPDGFSGQELWAVVPLRCASAGSGRARRFHRMRQRGVRRTEIQRPSLAPSSLTNRRSPVQILITYGLRSSHQMVTFSVMFMKTDTARVPPSCRVARA